MSAEELGRALLAQALLAEAEEAARGVHHLLIETGYPETDQEMHRIARLVEIAWTGWDDARPLSVGGGGDYTRVRVAGSRAAEFVDYLAGIAAGLDPGWWRVRTSAR